jgi:enoyl-CoA hydratase/carnithine racemase
MSEPVAVTTLGGRTLVITLNRPAPRNAVNAEVTRIVGSAPGTTRTSGAS